MTIDRSGEIPADVGDALPAAALELFGKTYNETRAGGATYGGSLFRSWEAVKDAGYQRGADGNYTAPKGERVEKRWRVKIFKLQEEKRVFYGWASVVEKGGVEVVDYDGDSWAPEEMEATAWDFVEASRQHGVMHASLAGSDLVASIPFTHDVQKALGIDLGLVGWLVGFRVNDLELWEKIRTGKLPMLSIGASGFRESVPQ